ncbi:MAG: hypothetical protein IJA07_05490 [Agathobacter sp.]|nr:hypothetical protein [Agathobacter sp.]
MCEEIKILNWYLEPMRIEGHYSCNGVLISSSEKGRVTGGVVGEITPIEGGFAMLSPKKRQRYICKIEDVLLSKLETTKQVLEIKDIDSSSLENASKLVEERIEQKKKAVQTFLQDNDLYLEFCGEWLQYCFVKRNGLIYHADTSSSIIDYSEEVIAYMNANCWLQCVDFQNEDACSYTMHFAYFMDRKGKMDSLHILNMWEGLQNVYIKQSCSVVFTIYGFEKNMVFRPEEEGVKIIVAGKENYRGRISMYKSAIKALEEEAEYYLQKEEMKNGNLCSG